MQVSTKKVQELLKALGLEDVEVVSDTTANEDADFKTEDYLKRVDAARASIIEPQLKDSIKTELEAGFKARMIGSVKSAFNRTGVKLTEEYSSVDDLVKEAVKTYNEKFSQDTESLRRDMEKMTEEHAAALTAASSQHEDALKVERNKFIDREIEELLQQQLKVIPRVGGNEISQAKLVKSWLREHYHLEFDPDKKSLDVRQKDKPESPVFNEGKTKLKELSDVVKEWVDEIGLGAPDTRHQNPLGAMTNTTNSKNTTGVLNDNEGLTPIQKNEAVLKNLLP